MPHAMATALPSVCTIRVDNIRLLCRFKAAPTSGNRFQVSLVLSSFGMSDPDAVVVGSAPNGLAAAIVLARAGCRVTVQEGSTAIGGRVRSEALTRPGFVHDVCSAIHPFAVASPFFR